MYYALKYERYTFCAENDFNNPFSVYIKFVSIKSRLNYK